MVKYKTNKEMDMELTYILQVEHMKECGKMISSSVQATKFIQMEMFMKEILLMDFQKDKVLMYGIMEKYIMGNGYME